MWMELQGWREREKKMNVQLANISDKHTKCRKCKWKRSQNGVCVCVCVKDTKDEVNGM